LRISQNLLFLNLQTPDLGDGKFHLGGNPSETSLADMAKNRQSSLKKGHVNAAFDIETAIDGHTKPNKNGTH
jgi:hypothetical protein